MRTPETIIVSGWRWGRREGGEEKGLYTGVVDYEVIEGDDALGLLVLRDGILPEFAVTEDIVGQDQAVRYKILSLYCAS